MPSYQALFHLCLHLREGLREPALQAPLALLQILAPGLSQAPLLLGEARKRVGARPDERPFEVRGALPKVPLDRGIELRLRPLELAVDSPALRKPAA